MKLIYVLVFLIKSSKGFVSRGIIIPSKPLSIGILKLNNGGEGPEDENKESNNDKKFDNSSEELEIFKNQSQLKAFGVLAAGFGTFLYFKLQYDTDPSNFIGGN